MISAEGLRKEQISNVNKSSSSEYANSPGLQTWLKIREEWVKVSFIIKFY